MDQTQQRVAVVSEALTWERTPYHRRGRIKGVGCDCAMFPAEVYAAAGAIPPVTDIPDYPLDWNQHRSDELYLQVVLRYAREAPAPTGPGDFVLWRWGRTFSHGAIIIEWPNIIHSVIGQGVIRDNALCNARLADHQRRRLFFTLW